MSKRILVVEDEDNMRELLGDVLKMCGYKVIFAEDGLEALSKSMEEKIDLIIMDVNLPKMDGYEAFKLMRENKKTRDIPVIVNSCAALMSTVDKFMALGARDYHLKSQGSVKLIDKIKKYI